MSWNFAYDSPSAIKFLLDAQGLAMSKKFGQNFLLSTPIKERIVNALEMEEGMDIWEIGPGIGALTTLLLAKGVLVKTFEIDHGFCRILRDFAFKDEPSFSLVEGDVLKTMDKQKDIPSRICGNLPYNVGSVVLAKLLEGDCRPPLMVFTLQKEVVARLCATVRDKNWSSLSLLCQMDYQCKALFDIKGGCFYPEPTVTSSVIQLRKREKGLVDPLLRDDFLLVVRDLFALRRKTIKNNLSQGKCGSRLAKGGLERMLADSGVDPSLRAEQLDWPQFIALAQSFSTHASICPSDNTSN